MATHATARSIRNDVAMMLRPPRRILVSDGAKALRVNAGTGTGNPWDASTTPYMVKPLNATASRLHEAVVFVGPARSGKTLALIEGCLAHTITCDPADVMVIQSTKDAAEDYSKTRISRAIRGSPDLLKQLSPRAHDDNVLMKFFRSGMSLRLGWPSLSVLSGKDVKRVLMTDVDNFTGDLGIDEAFGLAMKRCQTFMSGGIVVAESSPATDYTDGQWRPNPERPHEAPPAGGIASLHNRGDRHRWYWPCMECGEYFQAAPGYDLFRLPPEQELLERVQVDDMLALSRRLSIVYCPHCKVGLEDRWKDTMNLRGDWVGEGQVIHPDGSIDGDTIESRTRSYYLGGVAAAFQSWESLIERYLQALKVYAKTGEEKPLKTTYNVDAALNYVPMAARSDNNPSDMQ
ncbi:MAG: terminase, partial [Sphingomonas taxi]